MSDNWAPTRIWLQRGMGDEGSHTWCEDSIVEVRTDGDDIEETEYVRLPNETMLTALFWVAHSQDTKLEDFLRIAFKTLRGTM